MNIKVIFIASEEKEFIEIQRGERERIANQSTKLMIVSLVQAPETLESSYDETMTGRYLVEEVEEAEKEGFDAVVIDCALDPALRAAKEVSNIPVVSAGEAAIALALLLGSKFSIIAPTQASISPFEHNVRSYGLTSRLASIRHIGIPILELMDVDKAKSAIKSECQRAIEEDGADVIVLGCTGMAPTARYLNKALNVPVVEPGAAAIKVAELLAQLGWKHSKRCFPTPVGISNR